MGPTLRVGAAIGSGPGSVGARMAGARSPYTALITAWNPQSVTLTSEKNGMRTSGSWPTSLDFRE